MSHTKDDPSTESRKHYETLIEEVEQMSHLFGFEGRTPLNVIVGYADYLLSGQLGTLTDEQQKAIENIRATARRLLNIISFSRDELMLLNLLHGRTKPNWVRVEVQAWLETVTKGFAKVIESKNQRLVIDAPITLYANLDYYCCSKMMDYLIDNAHRYTGEGGQITITSTLRPNDILIAISDDGIGISAEEQDRIFDKGFRGSHEVVQQSVGLGRGLYNARRLAEVLGCEIGVESEVGKGSVFWFTLPLAGDGEEE